MKKLLIAVVLVAGALLAYNYATTGEVSLIPSFGLSEEEQQVKDLDTRFQAARKQITQAFRAASVGGIDTTADIEAGRRTVDQVARDLKQLRSKLTTESAKKRAAELAEAVRTYAEELR